MLTRCLTVVCLLFAASTPPKPDIGPVFEQVFPTLDDAVDRIDRHDELPDSAYLGEDKGDNTAAINKLLDAAIAALDTGPVTRTRWRIRELEKQIQQAHARVADYQRKKVSAPATDTLGLIDKANPFLTTKEGYGELIEAERENIQAWRKDVAKLKKDFRERLETIGLRLEEDAVDALLASVTGDDVLTLAVVFDHVKQITKQLQQLTEESGEALDAARRYYGMYVVLVRILDRVQTQFVREIREQYIPQLEQFAEQAARNIERAEKLIEADAGDAAVLRSNIEANRLTARTAELYQGYLKQQARMVERENEQVARNLATAINTYQTVKLSSDVAAMIRTGRESFETLMKLRLPYLREFQNDVIRREFERMTRELRRAD